MLVFTKDEDILACYDLEAANIIFHVHLIMTINTIHVSVVQLNVLWLIYLGHIMIQPPVCVNNISWVECVLKSSTKLLSYQTVDTKFELSSLDDL